MAAVGTQFGGRKEPVDLEIGSPIPIRLIFKFSEYLGERRISDVLGQLAILEHSRNVQPFDKDRLVLAYDLCGEFLNRISAGVADSGMKPGYFKPGFLSIIAVLYLARETALKFLQSLFPSYERARIFKPVSIACDCKGLNADVNANFGFDLLERLHVGFNQDADKVSLALVLADCKVNDLGVIG
jgi:hypothetical protein